MIIFETPSTKNSPEAVLIICEIHFFHYFHLRSFVALKFDKSVNNYREMSARGGSGRKTAATVAAAAAAAAAVSAYVRTVDQRKTRALD